MNIRDLVKNKTRERDVALSLMGVIPFLVFVYLLVAKVANINVLVGEVGYIMLATMVVFLTGIAVGRKMFWSMINELIERNRLAAVTETALALGHEINNPLLAISGNLELMEMDTAKNNIPPEIKKRLETIKFNCDRIRESTAKLMNLSRPVSTVIAGNARMVDLAKSR